MKPRLTPNYMRTHRREWGLSQLELGRLLGVSGSVVSRCELGVRKPSLEVVLAYEVIFGRSPSSLSPALYDAVEDSVMRRAARLSIRLEGRRDDVAAIQRKLLAAMVTRSAERSDV